MSKASPLLLSDNDTEQRYYIVVFWVNTQYSLLRGYACHSPRHHKPPKQIAKTVNKICIIYILVLLQVWDQFRNPIAMIAVTCRQQNTHSRGGKGKGKSVPLQVWTGLQGSRKLRYPDFVITARDCGKDVSLTHRPSLPQEILLVFISVRGWVDPRAIGRI